MEVVVNFGDLGEVLLLHPASGLTLRAVLRWIREQDLVDYNVVNIDLLLRQFDS